MINMPLGGKSAALLIAVGMFLASVGPQAATAASLVICKAVGEKIFLCSGMGGNIYNTYNTTISSGGYNASYEYWGNLTLTLTYNATYDAMSAGTEHDPLWAANYSALNRTWSNTYNSTYDAKPNNNYNASYEYWTNATVDRTYNSTYDAKNAYNLTYEYWRNATLDRTYNTSYEYWTNATLDMVYNVSYEYWKNATVDRVYNASYEYWTNATVDRTYNSTYDAKNVYNLTYEYWRNATLDRTYNTSYEYWTNATLDRVYNVSYEYWKNATVDRTYNSTYDTMSAGTESDPRWAANYSALNKTWADRYNSSYEYWTNATLDRTYNSSYMTNVYNLTYEYWRNATLDRTYNTSYEYWTNATLDRVYNVSYEYWKNATVDRTYNVSYEYWANATVDRTYNSTYDYTADNRGVTGLTANANFSSTFTLPWANLTSFPAACPAGQAITQLGSTPTCNPFGGSSAISGLENLNLSWSFNISWGNITGSLDFDRIWLNTLGLGNLTQYDCPGGQAISQLGGTMACIAVGGAGGAIANIENLNLSAVFNISWANITEGITGFDLNRDWNSWSEEYKLGIGNLSQTDCPAGNRFSRIGAITTCEVVVTTEGDPLFVANYTSLNASWSSRYNASYEYWNNATVDRTYNVTYEYWKNATVDRTYNSSYEYWNNASLATRGVTGLESYLNLSTTFTLLWGNITNRGIAGLTSYANFSSTFTISGMNLSTTTNASVQGVLITATQANYTGNSTCLLIVGKTSTLEVC